MTRPLRGQWGAYGEGLPHLRTSRWKHFVALLVLSGVMFALAGLFLPLVLLRPQKVAPAPAAPPPALCATAHLSALLSAAAPPTGSWADAHAPARASRASRAAPPRARSQFSLFFTLGSLLAMVAFAVLRGPLEQLKHMCSLRRLPFTSTYVGSMVLTLYAALVAQSYLLVLLFASIQCAALAWYVLSYVPGGAPALKLVTKLVSRGVRSCCGAAGASGTQQWTQLLPL